MQREIVPILQTLIKSINELTDDEYFLLLEGKGKLVFQEPEKKIKVTKNLTVDTYKKHLETIETRIDAKNYLKNIKKADLLDFAKENHIFASNSDKKDAIIDKIIELFIGVKLRNQAMQSIDLSYKYSKK